MALAAACLLPALEQEADLLLAADQRRELPRAQRRETVGHGARAQHARHLDRVGEALDRMGAEIGVVEQLADQGAGVRADHDAAGLGQRLQAGGAIGRVADHRLLLADQVAGDDLAGRDADPRRERHGEAHPADRVHQVEAGPDRPLGIVLMRLRVAEIGQHAVAQELGDVALEALDHPRAAVLIGAHDLAQVLRIETGREPGRIDQVDEHDGELAALRIEAAARRNGRRRGLLRTRRQLGDRAQQPLAVAERHAELRQVLLAQQPKGVAVDRLLGKGVGVGA